jgi:hypothetical protein
LADRFRSQGDPGGAFGSRASVQDRWEFGNEDFQRIWTFCTLLLLASLVYAFTANEGPADFREFFQNPNFSTQREAGTASARTAALGDSLAADGVFSFYRGPSL